MGNNKNYTLKDWLEEPYEDISYWKKSWFLNGNIPDYEKWGNGGYYEEGCFAYFYSEPEIDSLSRCGNIIQTCDDESSVVTYLLGCRELDFAICHMELSDDGELVVDTDQKNYPRKYSEDDEGWLDYNYDEKLLDKDGNEIEDLMDFDHSTDNDLFRVPYTDLDINALIKGEIVLAEEAEEKWKKILSGEIPAPQYGKTPANAQTDELTNYFLIINENGVLRDAPLYGNRSELYIKGDALESLKVLNENKFRIYMSKQVGFSAYDFATELYEIRPTPTTRLAGEPYGFRLEDGFCDIVGIRKKGEDENGNFDADRYTLDELLQD